MLATPLVSIVTPTLNQGRFIDATIRSIRAQSYDRLEHIVVDGGSTDETIDILRRSEGTYPMRWLSEPDRGMYDAVNKGMAMASGDILAYLNSDDLYFPWTLETVVDAFERDREADFVFGDAISLNDDSGRQDFYWTFPFDLSHLRTSGFLAQPAVFWRRSAYISIGPFDERLRYVADCDYWMKAGATHRFRKVDEFLAVERDHSATQRAAGSAVWDELIAVRSRYLRAGARPGPDRGSVFRERIWRRLYAVSLVTQATMPPRLRSSRWRGLLGASGFRFSRLRLLLGTIPYFGRRFAGRVIQSDRAWLENSAP